MKIEIVITVRADELKDGDLVDGAPVQDIQRNATQTGFRTKVGDRVTPYLVNNSTTFTHRLVRDSEGDQAWARERGQRTLIRAFLDALEGMGF